jgi:NAD(P)-dependent dehydrogenase (short-subunit alcohol dehydrogenase family)
MQPKLSGKVAIVTGSTSGIGEGIARRLAADGAAVVVTGRNTEAGERIAAELREAGGQAVFVRADVSQPEDCERLIAAAVERFGGLDGLVNNAGIFPRASLEESDLAHWEEVLRVNLIGVWLCCRAAIPALRERGGGGIVNVGSGNGYVGGGNIVAYAASKGGLLNLTKTLAARYAADNIRVNWITVGWIATPGEIAVRQAEGTDEATLTEWIERSTRLPGIATPADIGAGASFLLSDDARMVTACELNVSGGLTIR